VDAKQILEEALRLWETERAALASELIQSLEADYDPDAEVVWAAEIRRRLASIDAGTAATIPRSEAQRRIRVAAGRG
jgi:putative addiction module component (TIGR02574 family)